MPAVKPPARSEARKLPGSTAESAFFRYPGHVDGGHSEPPLSENGLCVSAKAVFLATTDLDTNQRLVYGHVVPARRSATYRTTSEVFTTLLPSMSAHVQLPPEIMQLVNS